LDENLRFLDAGNDKRKASGSILEVGVQEALAEIEWDQEGFKARGGVYDWSKSSGKSCSGGGLPGKSPKDLEW
jgi:radical S-adenosyl methionine domain-containing protein 2